MMQALGLIEVIGYPAAIEAADAALKASNVQLSGLSKVGSGIMTVQLFGDVGAIKAAVEAGGRAAEKLGKVRSAHVIPRVDESLIGTVIKRRPAANDGIANKGISELEIHSEGKEVNSSLNDSGVQNVSLTDEVANPGDGKDITINSSLGPNANEEVFSLEDLNKKSNTELRKLIEALGIDVSDKKLKEAKKAELIRIITDSKK